VDEDSPEFDYSSKKLFVKHDGQSGQKVTAIRRTIVPAKKIEAVQASINWPVLQKVDLLGDLSA